MTAPLTQDQHALCECPKCGRMHRDLGFGKPPATIAQEALNEEHYQAAMAMSEKHRKLWVEASQERDLLRASLTALQRGTPNELQERALKIIADEERFAASDPPGNIELYALRVARVGTAKQILGLLRMSEPVTAAALAAGTPTPIIADQHTEVKS